MRYLFKLLLSPIILILVFLSLHLLQERKIFNLQNLVRINPIPHTQQLIKEEKYFEAQEYLSYFIDYPYVYENPKSQELLQDIKLVRNSYSYQGKKLLEGIWKGKSDEDIGKTSAIVSDFLLIGDIRDLSIEGAHYYNNKKVDNVILALSSLGVIATVSTFYTAGATAPAKTSISVLKYAKKSNKLPRWLSSKLIKEAKIAKKSFSLDNIKNLLTPIHTLYEKVGLMQTLNLLKKTKNFKELTTIISFTSRFGKKSPTLLNISNNSAIKYIKKMPNSKNKNILYASTYGEDGLKAMSKMGEMKFMRKMKSRAHFIKSGYKGNFNSIFNYLFNKIPSWLLFTVAFLGLFYFMKNFYVLTKRLF